MRQAGSTSESGFALPLVMGCVVLLAIFMATAMTRATVGLDVSSHDVASKRAVQTAKAGMEVAIYRANGLGLDLNQLLDPSQQCLLNLNNVLGVQVLPAGSNWCQAVDENLGTGASFSYRVSSVVTLPGLTGGLLNLGTTNYLLRRRVVSTGTVDGVVRRVYAEFTADGSRSVTGVCLPLLGCANLVSSGFLQTYRIDPGTFRECRPTPPNPSDPASGC